MFNVHVEEVIQAGLVPRFVEFLTWDDFPLLQFEAAWALTNIASGTSENTEVVIDHGAVAILVRLLSSPYDGVREQVVWALGNISGDSPRCRDIVLGHGALPSLLLQLNNGDKLSMLVNAAWTLSNLCRGKPQPPYDQVSAALPALAHLIRLDDKELLAYTCWALVYLSDGSSEKIQAVIEANVCGRLIGLSVHRSPSVATPALRTIGIVVTGNDSQTQVRIFDWVIQLISRIWSDKKELLIEATTQIRTLLCGEMFNVHVEEVIQAGLVPRFVEFLTWDDFPQLQFEAAWALTNIASGTSENTEVVIDHGAVAILVRLLSSPYDGVREQVVWALGNISGDSPRCRDIVLGHSALPSLLLQLNNGDKLSMLVNAAWTLSNLCRGKPQPPYDQVSAALPALAHLIRLDDKELLAYTCWALVYLSDGSNEKIQAVIEANVCGRLIGLSVHRSPSVATPALRTIGIVVTGNDSQTQYIIDLQALPCLLNLLRGPYNKTIRKEACWVISNITAGCQSQIQAVYDADICPALVNLLRNSEFDVKYEAAWAICNAVAGGSYKQILTKLYVFTPFGLLQSFGYIFLKRVRLIEDAEGLEKIESLQSHENSDIYEMAVKILETYWLEEEEGEDEVEEEDKGRQDIVYFPVDNFANMPTPSCTLGLGKDDRRLGNHTQLICPYTNRESRHFTYLLLCTICPQVSAALPALAHLIRLDDKELLAYTCWALVYLSDGSSEKIQAVIEANVCGRLIGLSVHRSPSVATPALRTIGIVVTGNDSQTQYIIDLQALPCLLNLLRGPYNKTIRKEACWVVSNITAGCQSQIQAVFDADICPALVNLLRNSEFDVKYEAAWAICNAIAGGSYKQILDIYEMAVKILETYWLEEEEGEEEDKGRQDMVYFPVEKFANMPTPSCTLGLSTDVGFLFRGDHFGLEQSLVLFCRVWEELVKLKPNNFDLIWLSLVLVLLDRRLGNHTLSSFVHTLTENQGDVKNSGDVTKPHGSAFSMKPPCLEFGFSQPQMYTKYPCVEEEYYGVVVSAYGSQSRVMLPLNMETEDGTIYVNSKQYHGIIRRRQSRAKAASVLHHNKLSSRGRKPYMHHSRHLHALRRPRGSGGRFLNTKSQKADDTKQTQSQPQKPDHELITRTQCLSIRSYKHELLSEFFGPSSWWRGNA
ncbi:hypothetical protein F2Q70_00023937 [Brassica cretica]|uniref:Importin subunit alpha n=1 Tax=Brassica cretica TaxID=69181 RepID=A0A8S9GLL9_BRACR|nr:hypothetical protein F2Q70_00023937 [Brassica cretica]